MSYKLTYFDLRGRAEVIRLILTAAGVKFEDNRIKGESWPTVKPTTPWGQLPVLEVNGKPLAQATTISRFLGRKFKLAGADEWEAAKCDEYVDACNDLFTEWQKFYFEKDPAKKSELKQEFTKNHCAKFLSKMNTIQQENGGAFLVGKEMTWADITIAERLERLETTVDAGILSGYPNLRKMKEAVLGGPKIKEWIAKRPVE